MKNPNDILKKPNIMQVNNAQLQTVDVEKLISYPLQGPIIQETILNHGDQLFLKFQKKEKKIQRNSNLTPVFLLIKPPWDD